ncbi:MAG: UDP-N-acetylmuramoyl-tripeptide--D-alanyl-D-alanine ligase [Planctomycetota bacterium]
MKPLTIDELRQAVRGRWLRSPNEPSVGGVSTDTRTARAGDLLFALRGERFDAHDYLPQAEQAGCAAAVVARDAPQLAERTDGQMGLLLVGDPLQALGELAAFYRGLTAATVVAVTGSNGKTTVKRMIDHILSRRLVGRCSPRSYNNAVGVPLTLLGIEPADEYAVCEIGTNAPGEVASLGGLVRPDVAVVTSVSAAHTEKLGDVDRVAVEKASLLGCVSPGGLAVVWSDSPPLQRAVGLVDGAPRVVRFGRSDEAELRLTDYRPTGAGQRFEVNGRLWVELPVPGRHNAVNALAALAVARRFGFELDAAGAALADFSGVEMRLQRVAAGAVTILDDAYNANPASVLAAADVLSETPARRRVAVIADMLELGDRSAEMHRRTGRDLAARELDLLIGVGELGRYVTEGAHQAGATAECVADAERAATEIPPRLRAGDVVLVKGSRGMRMERVVAAVRRAFDESPGPVEARAEEDAAS